MVMAGHAAYRGIAGFLNEQRIIRNRLIFTFEEMKVLRENHRVGSI